MSVSGAAFDTDIKKLWSVADMRNDQQCTVCNSQDFNNWYVCTRRSSLVNLHIGYVSRPRQSWLMAMSIAKFLVIPYNYDGPYFPFQGSFQQPVPVEAVHPTVAPRTPKNAGIRVVRDTSVNRSMPRFQHAATAIAYRKNFLFISILT